MKAQQNNFTNLISESCEMWNQYHFCLLYMCCFAQHRKTVAIVFTSTFHTVITSEIKYETMWSSVFLYQSTSLKPVTVPSVLVWSGNRVIRSLLDMWMKIYELLLWSRPVSGVQGRIQVTHTVLQHLIFFVSLRLASASVSPV